MSTSGGDGTEASATVGAASDPVPDLSHPRRIHVVPIGGIAMNAIAHVLRAMGHEVSGSHAVVAPAAVRLRDEGIRVEIGHHPDHVGDAELLAISTSVGPDHPEVVEAQRRGVPVHSRAGIMTALTRLRKTVAVAGTHGKTTTSSMLAVILREAGWDPSFIIGGDIGGIGTGAAWRDTEWLVVEADESDGTFLDLDADAVLVTSVEADHLDHFGTIDRMVEDFDRFVARAPGPRVVWADADLVAGVAARSGATTYGTAPAAEYRITDLALGRFEASFRIVRAATPAAVPGPAGSPGRGTPPAAAPATTASADETVADIRLAVPGAHNAANATGAAVMALLLGVDRAAVEAGLARFSGVARRFHLRGEAGGVTYVDDYAHNPGKVRSVLRAARAGGWDRIVCVFQPHRFGRTTSLLDEYAEAFTDADVVVVTDIYAGPGEDAVPGITGQLVADAILAADPSADVVYAPGRDELVAEVAHLLRPGDLCLTLGAGDITTLPDQLLEAPA